MDSVKFGLVGDGRYAVAPMITALDVLEATRVSFERHSMPGLGAEL